jgi:NADH dehydrogenase
MAAATRIVVLGAGFGGLEAVLELERRFRGDPRVELTLVSEQNYFLFTPLLPQVVSCYIEPRHIVQSLRDIRRQRAFRFLRARALALDLAERRVQLDTGPLPFDYLVLALGSTTDFFGTPGAAEHCFSLRSLEDAVGLRDHLLDLFEHADHESDAARQRDLLSVVVVGGGYTGVELVAELRDLVFRHIVPRYRGIKAGDVRLVLLEAGDDILRGVDPALAERARRKLTREGIEVQTGAKVTRVTPEGVEVNQKEPIRASAVIWTAGVRAHPLAESLPVEKDKSGRLVVTSSLQLRAFPRVFVIGDAAVVEKAPPEQSLRLAPVALAQGRVVAENIVRAMSGQMLVPFAFEPTGMLVSLGMNDAVIQVMGVKLAGTFAWLAWNAIHLLKLVGVKKQMQVALDWSLATVFPRDTSIIRRPQRCRLCQAAAPPPLGQS